MLLSAVMALEECLERIRSGPVPPHEEATKFQLIAPILRNLGWNPDDGTEFLLEHSAGGTGGKVDIALAMRWSGGNAGRSQGAICRLESACRASVEIRLSGGCGYLRSDHRVGVVAVPSPREGENGPKRRFAVLDLMNDSVDRLAEDLNAFLAQRNAGEWTSRNKSQAGVESEFGGCTFGRRSSQRSGRTMLDEPDEELVELIGSRVYEKLNLRPEKSQVIAALRGNPVPIAGELHSSVAEVSQAPAMPERAGHLREGRLRSLLWGVRHPVFHTQGNLR